MWGSKGATRWAIDEWTDRHGRKSDRQMLTIVGNKVLELHGSTVHVYQVANPGQVDPAAPLANATHLETFLVDEADVPAGVGEGVWQALAAKANRPTPPGGR